MLIYIPIFAAIHHVIEIEKPNKYRMPNFVRFSIIMSETRNTVDRQLKLSKFVHIKFYQSQHIYSLHIVVSLPNECDLGDFNLGLKQKTAVVTRRAASILDSEPTIWRKHQKVLASLPKQNI